MDKIWITGDIHGDFRPIRNFYKSGRMSSKDNNYLIILGDFGGNYFFNKRDDHFKKHLGKYDLTYFVIRGNHEERPVNCMARFPKKWHLEIFWGNAVWVENDYPYIKYALDVPSKYTIGNKTALVYPGAYSVDKEFRLARGYSYFPEEQMTEYEQIRGIHLAEKTRYCDYIFAHTCPSMFEPYICDLFLRGLDQSKIDKTTENYLNTIINMVKYERFYFGHYHDNRNIIPYKATMLFDNVIELGEKL